ncbi:vacuolar aminopeptidase 1 [Lithohypha guttulata]|uniref:Vacuolar aminopeptidase 1 n=1 Tax=Lithohypha guttulata TaxID=1690604 RepID=A0AAN7YBW2_9EURO|nr:vacuolar aminopeptidase 1 [Lithohypha guttulata]KAK5087810.1 vacuolar aminopeptidase 1 [Lithohypha guttulata]KAK5095446.1 vacuolar aminopeptidase 1 [Lithohypha guttulata]
MVRKTSSGFFRSTPDTELPYRVARGYDRLNTTHFSYSSSSSSFPRFEDQKPIKKEFDPSLYTLPYVNFMTDNPTIFHAVDALTKRLEKHGYKYLSERSLWDIKPGGKYYTKRNDSSFIAFNVGKEYKPGNGVAIVAGHVDALTAKLKPVSKVPNKAGYIQLGVAPYAGGMNTTWWDRDLGIGGRVLIKTSSGKVETKLVNLGWPIARIPTLAPHFGAAAVGPFNKETQMVPIIGIDNSDLYPEQSKSLGTESKIKPGTFAATQPPKLVDTICKSIGIQDYSDIVSWELELFDIMPAQLGGLDHEFIFAGRIDDKLCCFAAVEALIASENNESTGIIKMVGCFDDEEIGSYLRQGARSNFMDSTISRIVEATNHETLGPNLKGQVLANSFLVSSDVIHAVNPNFLNAYLENHSPRLNVGIAVSADPNGNMTTDSVSTALLKRVAEKCGSILQVFQIRNDSRSGGTIGPMTSSALGCRAIDCGIPQLSMHSIRATTGSLDPGLGVKLYKGFFDYYEEVDKEFE